MTKVKKYKTNSVRQEKLRQFIGKQVKAEIMRDFNRSYAGDAEDGRGTWMRMAKEPIFYEGILEEVTLIGIKIKMTDNLIKTLLFKKQLYSWTVARISEHGFRWMSYVICGDEIMLINLEKGEKDDTYANRGAQDKG